MSGEYSPYEDAAVELTNLWNEEYDAEPYYVRNDDEDDDVSYHGDPFAVLFQVAAARMLSACTGDGAVKRARGEKVPWPEDPTHIEHFWNHWNAWLSGVKHDPDSNQHPLVHAAWRLLAEAYREGAR